MHYQTETPKPNPIQFQAAVSRAEIAAAMTYYSENKADVMRHARECEKRAVTLLGAYLNYQRQPTSGAGAWLVYHYRLYCGAYPQEQG